jgi:HlyD family secretion protein
MRVLSGFSFSSLSWLTPLGLLGVLLFSTGCTGMRPGDAQTQPPKQQADNAVAIDAVVAKEEVLKPDRAYTGTTRPAQEVLLRSQAEGRVTSLSVDVGDRVQQGQVLGQLDNQIASSSVAQAEAEVAAREAESASAQAAVDEAQTQIDRARLEAQQARSDAGRQNRLLSQGAISEQAAESATTEAATAEQAVRSAERQLRNRQQAVQAAQKRVAAQQAIVAQAQERQSFGVLISPVDGVVLERPTEVGNLAQPGSEILKLADFSQIKIEVRVSELELATLQPGKSVPVRLDAFPNQNFTGRIARISPAADPQSRLIPIEVTIPNANNRIGSGLLARVSFPQQAGQRIVVPETAIQPNTAQANRQRPSPPARTATVFVVNRSGDQASVAARPVQLGNRADGRLEIISGIRSGETVVVRSSGELKEGTAVRLSAVSEQPKT